MIRKLGALLAFCLGLNTILAAEPLPIEIFLAPPEFRTPKLSPDGRFYGVVGVRENVEFLATIEIATSQVTPVLTLKMKQLVNYWWKSSGALLFQIENREGVKEFRTFDLTTKKTNTLDHLNLKGVSLVDPRPNDPEQVLMSANSGSGGDLRLVNLRNGKSNVVQKNPGFIETWITNREGKAVAGFGYFEKRWFMLVPSDAGKNWRRIELGEKNLPDFWPRAVAPDQRRILGFDNATADTARAVVWDPATDTTEVIWHSPDVDFDDFHSFGDDTTRQRAVAYETDRPRFYFLDSADRTLAQEIDQSLPSTVNVIVSTSQDESKMIIRSFSDTIPEAYFLLDRKVGRIVQLGSAHPRIDPARMAASRFFSFKARDGVEVHGRVLVPTGATGPSPAVLFTGNSFSRRSEYLFQPYLQLLASRGYAAILIDHRGTDGRGQKFAEAGNLQIGGAMVDDLADGLNWLVREGTVDPRRVAILGQDHGGLLAIQTLAKNPSLFAAWINFSTPMDANYLEFREVVFGLTAGFETKALAASGKGKAYLRTLDPEPILPAIKVPSLHYYPRNQRDNSLLFDGHRAENFFRRSAVPNVFMKGLAIDHYADFLANRDKLFQDEHVRIYTELLTFLGKHLAPLK